jgi:eukaryotic-like serine/threonine-protein kinase
MADLEPLQPGDPRSAGEYRITGRIGKGGQGVVYRGESRGGEPVAVKLLQTSLGADARARARFMREAELAMRVAVFCTARVVSAGMVDDRPYIVSEYIDGPSLQRRVAERGALTGGDLTRLAIGTATALAAIHHAGIVHRDFKPGNVLLGPDGPRVIDFGIALSLDTTPTLTSQVVGTPAYMAPERFSQTRADAASDLFAWGATVAFAATGRAPFGDDTVPVVINRLLNEEPDLDGLEGPVRELVERCLDKDPRRRPRASGVLLGLVDGDRGTAGTATSDLPGPTPVRTAALDVVADLDAAAGTDDGPPFLTANLAADLADIDLTAEIEALGGPAGSPPAPAAGGARGAADPSVPAAGGAVRARRRRWNGWRSWPRERRVVAVAGVGALIVAAGLAAAVAPPAASGPATAARAAGASKRGAVVPVPDVVRLSKEAATAKLSAAGLDTGTVTYDCAAPDPGRVARTSPPPGTDRRAGEPVDLVVAAGEARLPDARGRPVEEVRAALEAAGFAVELTREPSAYWAGKVFSQQPLAGAYACPGTTVTLTVGVAPGRDTA